MINNVPFEEPASRLDFETGGQHGRIIYLSKLLGEKKLYSIRIETREHIITADCVYHIHVNADLIKVIKLSRH